MKKSILIKILSILTILFSTFFTVTACKQEESISSLTLKFNVDGAVYQTITFEGGELTLPNDPTKQGYAFDGWYLDENVWAKPLTAGYFTEIKDKELTVYAKFITAHLHDYQTTVTNPTCLTEGYTVFTCACGDTYIGDKIAPLGHDITTTTVNPTCTEMGYVNNVCANGCGYSYKTTFTNVLGHDYENYVSDNNATCFEDGTKTAVCEREGCNETDTIVDEDSKIEVEISFSSLTVNGNKLTKTVNSDVSSFDFSSEITLSNGVEYAVYEDKNGINLKNNVVNLEQGNNKLYVFITVDGETVGVYNVEIYRVPVYQVSFNTNGGSLVASQNVVENGVAVLPTEIPTKENYIFDKWDYDFATPITGHVEINAIWKEDVKFTSFNIKENTVKTEYEYLEDVNLLSIVANVKYNFSKYDKILTYNDLTFEYDENLTEVGGVHVITVKYYDELLKTERSLNLNVSVEYLFLKTESNINMFASANNDQLDFASKFKVNGNLPLTYVSSDTSVLSFNGSVATAKKAGEVTVTVSNVEKGLTATVAVTVYPNAINVSSESIRLLDNESVDFSVVSVYETLNYTFTQNGIAVYENGKIIAKSAGATILKISNTDNTVTVQVSIEVISSKVTSLTVNSLSNPMINLFGRNQLVSGGVQFEYTVSGFEFKFYGTSAYAEMSAVIKNGYMPRFQVLVDGEKVDQTEVDLNGQNTEKSLTSTNGQKIININSESKAKYVLVEGLTEGWHTVKVLKRTPAKRGGTIMDKAILYTVSVNNGGCIDIAPKRADVKIELYGDSISCTYGNLYKGDTMHNNTTNGLLGYHYLAAEMLGAEINVQAHSGWGILYDTSGAKNWLWPNYYNKFSDGSPSYDMSYDADIIVINLGTNDTSGVSKDANFVNNFATTTVTWVKQLLSYNPDAKVLLTYGMMGKNTKVISGYESAVSQLKAQGYNDVYYYTYEGTYDGGGHPSKEDHISNSTYLANKISEILGLNK